MPLKWYVFGFANYLMLAAYIILFDTSFRFIFEEVGPDESLVSFFPIIVSQGLIIVASVVNLYIFHKRLPNKLLSRTERRVFLISSILFIAAFSFLTVITFVTIYNESFQADFRDVSQPAMILWFFHFFIGIFIIINQVEARRILTKKDEKKISV